MSVPDLIVEIVRLKGTDESVDKELKYLISKFTPTSKSIQIAKECMDKEGNLIVNKLPPYNEMFPSSLIEELKKFTTWQDFTEKYDKINPTNPVDFNKSLNIMMRMKPKKRYRG